MITICPDNCQGLGCQVSSPSSPWCAAQSGMAWCPPGVDLRGGSASGQTHTVGRPVLQCWISSQLWIRMTRWQAGRPWPRTWVFLVSGLPQTRDLFFCSRHHRYLQQRSQDTKENNGLIRIRVVMKTFHTSHTYVD